ncbi:YitT family protein [Clostridiaceae bacterium OF09-1]|nr:YitT family protein [Clostridiaceae bacterium OF09-1]
MCLKKLKLLEKFSPFNFLMLLIAGVINAIGVTLFIAPVQLYDSGISGTSILLGQLTPEWLSLSFFLIVLNIPLLLFGLKRQGVVFSVYAIFTVCIYSLSAWMITDVLPIDVSIASPLAGTDLFLCALFGGLISGIGSGLAIRYGGAMDGIEVVAVVFAKKLGISVGTFVLIYNVLLYIICGIVRGSWILPLYSIVTYAAGSKTVDFIVDGLDSAKAAMIITTRPNQICQAVSEEFGTGLTILDAHGYYSNTSKTVLYVVVNRFQIVRLKTIVKGMDPCAYMAISLWQISFMGAKKSKIYKERVTYKHGIYL